MANFSLTRPAPTTCGVRLPETCATEFETVDLIVFSRSIRRGVDAFALSVLKAERQMRRLLTHLVFQFPCFTQRDVGALRNILWRNKKIYFEGFERGFDALYPRPVRHLVGAKYAHLRQRLAEAIVYRNKIFHGQLTSKCLTTEDLLGLVADIRGWCDVLARGANTELGYDGFALPSSFRKSAIPMLHKRLKLQFVDIDAYEQFLKQHVQRHRKNRSGA